MAKQLNKIEIRMGNFIHVKNTQRKNSAAKSYYAIKLEDRTGGNEAWYLFTPREYYRLSDCVLFNVVEPKKGRLILKFKIGNSIKSLYKVAKQTDSGATYECIVSIPSSVLAKAYKRAQDNPEDVPKMSWLQDMRD